MWMDTGPMSWKCPKLNTFASSSHPPITATTTHFSAANLLPPLFHFYLISENPASLLNFHSSPRCLVIPRNHVIATAYVLFIGKKVSWEILEEREIKLVIKVVPWQWKKQLVEPIMLAGPLILTEKGLRVEMEVTGPRRICNLKSGSSILSIPFPMFR